MPVVQGSKPDIGRPIGFEVTAVEFKVDTSIPKLGGVMDETEFKALIKKLTARKGVDMLKTPRVKALSGEPVKIDVVKEFIYPDAYEAPKVDSTKGTPPASFPVTPATPISFKMQPTGVGIDIKAEILADGYIDMIVDSRVTEFTEFLDFGSPITGFGKDAFGKEVAIVLTENRILSPIFENKRVKSRMRIRPGYTVCLGGMRTSEKIEISDKIPLLGDLPLVGGVFRSEKEGTQDRLVYFFIKPEVEKADSAK